MAKTCLVGLGPVLLNGLVVATSTLDGDLTGVLWMSLLAGDIVGLVVLGASLLGVDTDVWGTSWSVEVGKAVKDVPPGVPLLGVDNEDV